MPQVTAQDLREIVRELINPTIDIHRASAGRQFENSGYWPPQGPADDDEVDRFIAGNALFDAETQEQLLDPGLLGFAAKRAHATDGWLRGFRKNIQEWAATEHWQGADEPWLEQLIERQPVATQLWIPRQEPQPRWIGRSPSALFVARQALNEGRLLADLSWQQFEDLIAELLENDGWTVSGLKRTKDGGIDVWATILRPDLGEVQSIWQAKKYGPRRKVQLHQVRELSGLLDRSRASKALIVTTSALTRGAIEWIREDKFRLGYHDAVTLAEWVRSSPKRLK